MPDYDPNDRTLFDPTHGKPVLESVSAGTLLYRVHHEAHAANELNPTIPGRYGGGRFDSHDGSYSYLYASTAPEGAIAERLMRLLKFGTGPRLLPELSVSGLILSELRVETPIPVLSLVGADAAQVGQDL